MKALQKKIWILVISSVLISALVVMVIAFTNYERIVESNSEQIMQLMCSEKRQAIDEKLLNIEQSVHTIYHFATEQISKTENLWQEEARFSEHISRMKALMETTAKYTDGAVSVYYRLSPEVVDPKQGIWLVQNENGVFSEHEITDVTEYAEDDIEHVGWYYIPISNRKETWINPYYNKNMSEEIISYVIPIILEEKVIGVVGMDIATQLLYENTKAVSMYETGYAFLMDNNGKFVYHPEMAGNEIEAEFNHRHAYLYEKSLVSAEHHQVEDYCWNNVKKKMMAQELRNGMIFAVCVTEQEIRKPRLNVLLHSLLVITVVMIGFLLVAGYITKVIIKMMYTDAMTKVGNKAAYTECVDVLNKQIEEKVKPDFTVVVADINNLKKVNDTYGHAYGDILIQNGAAILKKVWGSKSVYRIGGDEFTIIYSGEHTESFEKTWALFEKTLQEYCNQNEQEELNLQIAIGKAVYNPETDEEYMDVFRRADSAMYEDKKQKKKQEALFCE